MKNAILFRNTFLKQLVRYSARFFDVLNMLIAIIIARIDFISWMLLLNTALTAADWAHTQNKWLMQCIFKEINKLNEYKTKSTDREHLCNYPHQHVIDQLKKKLLLFIHWECIPQYDWDYLRFPLWAAINISKSELNENESWDVQWRTSDVHVPTTSMEEE